MPQKLIYRFYGIIGYDANTADEFSSATKHLSSGDSLLCVFNSPGGMAGEGLAIYNELKMLKGKGVDIVTANLAEASSAAILPFLAADTDKRFISFGSTFLLHRPSLLMSGFTEDLVAAAGYLEKLSSDYVTLYAGELGIDESTVSYMMDGDGTLFTSAEAVINGFGVQVDYNILSEYSSDTVGNDDKTQREFRFAEMLRRINVEMRNKNKDKKDNVTMLNEKQETEKKAADPESREKVLMEGRKMEIERRKEFRNLCPVGYEVEMERLLEDAGKTAADFAMMIAKSEKEARAAAIMKNNLDEQKDMVPPVFSNDSENKGEKYHRETWKSSPELQKKFWTEEVYVRYMNKKNTETN
jgi:ATP-dependent protease ClpP protease subunit